MMIGQPQRRDPRRLEALASLTFDGRYGEGHRRNSLAGCSVLVVEDEPLIALDLHATLQSAGASVIAGCSVGDAIKLIWRAEIAAAVVDVRLGSDDCSRVCRALASRGMPFVFYTAYSTADVLDQWPEAPVISKPARMTKVVTAVAALLESGI